MPSLFSNDVAVLCGGLLFGVLLVNLFQRYWHLKHVPGPFIASVTNLWYLYQFWTGVSFKDLSTRLHSKYGPVVRLGPNRLLFAQPDAIPIIFSSTHAFKKAESYDTITQLVKGEEIASLITIRDERRISAMKKDLASAFTTASMLKQEVVIDRKLDQLSGILESHEAAVNISPLLSFWAFDIVSEIAFSEDPGFLTHRTDIDDALAGGRARFTYWHHWTPVPWLERLLFKNKFQQKMAKPSLLAKVALKKLENRKVEGDPESQHDLLGKYLAAVQNNPRWFKPGDVIGLTISTINAGADTTATTLTIMLANLCLHPQVMARLRRELVEHHVNRETNFLELNKLEFLDAVIKESMRFEPTNVDPLEREVPKGGAVICDVNVPEGTTVGLSHFVANRDESVWGSDAAEFNPDRWVEADVDQRRAMERTFTAFSSGRRICLGQHLATIEMKKALARLLTTFEISLVGDFKPKLGVMAIAYTPVLEVKLKRLE